MVRHAVWNRVDVRSSRASRTLKITEFIEVRLLSLSKQSYVVQRKDPGLRSPRSRFESSRGYNYGMQNNLLAVLVAQSAGGAPLRTVTV
jgi:hypothetical protein